MRDNYSPREIAVLLMQLRDWRIGDDTLRAQELLEESARVIAKLVRDRDHEKALEIERLSGAINREMTKARMTDILARVALGDNA